MIDHVFFPFKEGLDTSGRTWQKAGIEKVEIIVSCMGEEIYAEAMFKRS